MHLPLFRFSGVAGLNGNISGRDVEQEVRADESSVDLIFGKDSERLGVARSGFDSVLMVRLLAYVGGMKTVQIGVCVEAVYFEDFGDEAKAGAPFNLNDNVERISDVGFDGPVRKFDIALQNTTCES